MAQSENSEGRKDDMRVIPWMNPSSSYKAFYGDSEAQQHAIRHRWNSRCDELYGCTVDKDPTRREIEHVSKAHDNVFVGTVTDTDAGNSDEPGRNVVIRVEECGVQSNTEYPSIGTRFRCTPTGYQHTSEELHEMMGEVTFHPKKEMWITTDPVDATNKIITVDHEGKEAPQPEFPPFTAKVTNSGGGQVIVLVDDDTVQYPPYMSRVRVVPEDFPPTGSEIRNAQDAK